MRAKRLQESVPWVIHLLESEIQCVSLCASVRVRQSATALCIFLHVACMCVSTQVFTLGFVMKMKTHCDLIGAVKLSLGSPNGSMIINIAGNSQVSKLV